MKGLGLRKTYFVTNQPHTLVYGNNFTTDSYSQVEQGCNKHSPWYSQVGKDVLLPGQVMSENHNTIRKKHDVVTVANQSETLNHNDTTAIKNVAMTEITTSISQTENSLKETEVRQTTLVIKKTKICIIL